jgi:crotonobetainyl-CoA:carnitine CoA-transferase CaiB-like acyl-CoA transferase
VLEDPHLHARDMIASAEHAVLGAVRVLGVPIKLSDTPGGIESAPPVLGQHTEQILRGDLGMRDAEIAELRASQTV